MAANAVTIAKASLIAPFVRPDPVSVSRDEVSILHECLDDVLRQCSRPHIQRCREWLCRNATTNARVAAVGKYLTALSSSLKEQTPDDKGKGTSTRRKRLHILYVLNDWLHHIRHHPQDSARLAGAFDKQKFPKVHRRIAELLSEWEKQDYYSTEFLQEAQEAVTKASQSSDADEDSEEQVDKNQPDETQAFVMPEQHGDSSTPWYDLPAANMLHHIEPNSAKPIDPQKIMPLRLKAGPADRSLELLVTEFMSEVDVMYENALEDDKEMTVDFDALGQKMLRDKGSDDVIWGDTYYGWSKEFCERMQKRLKEERPPPNDDGERDRFLSRGRDYNSTMSRSRSRSHGSNRYRKRDDRSRSWSRTRSRSESRSRSRSRSSDGHHRPRRSRSPHRRSGSRSRQYSRSSDRPGRMGYQKKPSDAASGTLTGFIGRGNQTMVPPPPSLPTGANMNPSFIPPPPPLGAGFNMPPALANLAGMFPPGGSLPPPPPGWTGPWPPPPPLPIPQGGAVGTFPPFPPPFGQGVPPLPPHFYPNSDSSQPTPDPRRRQ